MEKTIILRNEGRKATIWNECESTYELKVRTFNPRAFFQPVA